MNKKKYSIFNMYATTTVSISLVLFFIGSLFLLFFLTRGFTRDIKENVSVSVVLYDDIDSTELARIHDIIAISSYVNDVNYISKEAALAEHITSLGDDPSLFLGYNPLLASLQVRFNSESMDTLAVEQLKNLMSPFLGVKEVVYDQEMFDVVSRNIASISWVLLLVTGLLFVIALILISNTIRLSIYSKRFIINTMKLVGATPWVIRAPFIRKNLLMGLFASIVAIGMIYTSIWYIENQLGLNFIIPNIEMLTTVFALVFFLGIIMTFISSYIAVGKYIRMKTNDLYYI